MPLPLSKHFSSLFSVILPISFTLPRPTLELAKPHWGVND